MPKKVLKTIAGLLLFVLALEARWVFNPFTGQLDFTESSSGVTSAVIAGTANQIAVSGTCTITSTGTCTIGFAATPVLPNGTTGTTQSQADNSTKVATTAYVDTGLATKAALVTSPYSSLFSGFSAYFNPEPCISGTIAYTDINNVAATTKAISIGTVSEPFSPRVMYVYESTAFAGSITTLTVSLGTGGSSTYYLSAFALKNGSPTTHDGGPVPPASNTSTSVITALFTGNTNLNGGGVLTAGVIQVKICGVALQ